MTRMTLPAHPLLLGFEDFERLIERSSKPGGDGYPPYNVERMAKTGDEPDVLRITLAVAGFARGDLDVLVEDKQLTVRGKQSDERPRDYVYRGIAARQFCRTFVLADGLEVRSADLDNGLLSIDLVRREPVRSIRSIAIGGDKPKS